MAAALHIAVQCLVLLFQQFRLHSYFQSFLFTHTRKCSCYFPMFSSDPCVSCFLPDSLLTFKSMALLLMHTGQYEWCTEGNIQLSWCCVCGCVTSTVVWNLMNRWPDCTSTQPHDLTPCRAYLGYLLMRMQSVFSTGVFTICDYPILFSCLWMRWCWYTSLWCSITAKVVIHSCSMLLVPFTMHVSIVGEQLKCHSSCTVIIYGAHPFHIVHVKVSRLHLHNYVLLMV